MKRTQVLLPEEMHQKLRERARSSNTSMGELIRSAVEKVYFVRLDEIALEAYRNGLISLGKLAELSGTNPIKALELLREQGIKPLFGPESREEALKDAETSDRPL